MSDIPSENAASEETQYLDLIRRIIKDGSYEKGRNGNTYSVFGNSMRFSLKDGVVPLLTTKHVAWKTCLKELLWFLSGSTSNTTLKESGVHIWDKNATREFLDGAGLSNLAEDDLGPVYGHQWRHFNAEYTNSDTDYSGKGVDQIQWVINQLKNPETRSSRRLVVSAWNPIQLDKMALPPCHILMQFNVREQKYLSCSLYQRSGDVGLGVPFNIASYSFLTHLMAAHCGLIADEFVYFLGNAHIYEEHKPALLGQIERTMYSFPKIRVNATRAHIEDYEVADIEWLSEYKHHPRISMEMIA
jgi:thymidylate synthase